MRNRGRFAAGAAVTLALLGYLTLRGRGDTAPEPEPEPESESRVPAEAVEAPPLLERMPTLLARPRAPRRLEPEIEALLDDPAGERLEKALAATAGGEPVARLVGPAAPPAPVDAWPPPPPPPSDYALLPGRPEADDPPWPLFTDDAVGRRVAMRRGYRARARLDRLQTEAGVWAADRIRRDLTEGLFLPETADPAVRAALAADIEELNSVVYRWKRPMAGVTEIVVAKRGDYPYKLVAERPFGSNVLLRWNLVDSLDPRHLPAGVPLVVPLEPLTLLVDRDLRALFLLLGDAFVREFPIGVGAPWTPTPAGRFQMTGNRIDLRIGRDPARLGALGTAWMETWTTSVHPSLPSGRGPTFHGTDKPDSIGLAESDGSIRMRNPDASELLRWVDTHHGGPIRVYVR
jgi:hypothetical protein